MLVGIFGALTQYERVLINERAEVAREAVTAREAGESVEDIRSVPSVGRSTLDRLLAEESTTVTG